MPSCSLTISGSSLVVKTPYDAGFVAALKSLIPATQRKFDKDLRAWLVDTSHSHTCASLIQQYFNELVFEPMAASIKQISATRILEIRYLGQCKDRGGEISAFGLDSSGEWSAVFPETVLREWFMDGQTRPGSKQTLYQVLGVAQSVDAGEIKSAFRRLARQWHPDVCKEPDAAQVFMRIKSAYELLADTNKRARYDAGLVLEASVSNQRTDYAPDTSNYRAPLRCGFVLANGHESLGRFIIDKILSWEDITDNQGRVLVTSWPMGATKPVEAWA